MSEHLSRKMESWARKTPNPYRPDPYVTWRWEFESTPPRSSEELSFAEKKRGPHRKDLGGRYGFPGFVGCLMRIVFHFLTQARMNGDTLSTKVPRECSKKFFCHSATPRGNSLPEKML